MALSFFFVFQFIVANMILLSESSDLSFRRLRVVYCASFAKDIVVYVFMCVLARKRKLVRSQNVNHTQLAHTYRQRRKLWRCVGARSPRLNIVGKSDTLSVNLDQFLVKLS